MKKSALLFLFSFSIAISNAQVDTILWLVDNLSQIGGHDVSIIGNPQVIDTELGFAVEFDGVNDGLLVDGNPMAGATEFTVEIIFKAYTGGGVEQRFLHFQQDNDNRILIELRNNNDENWTLDTFIKSGSSSQALLDYSFVHPLDEWAHAALVFKDGKMEHFVNGEKELEGTVDYVEVNSGQTSLGVRMNLVSWFKGAIHSVRVTHEALEPEGFLEIDAFTSVEDKEASPLVSEIFPNPVHSTSQLNYQLQKAANVSIQLLDIDGKEIANLYKGFKSAGAHQLDINSEQLSAGVYFVVINAGKERAVQKITVVE